MQGLPSNYYARLGLDHDCTQEQIRAAYRLLAKAAHPDLNPATADALARTQALNVAYETLSDPTSRQAYDEALKAQESVPRAGGRAPRNNLQQDVQLKIEEFLRGTSLQVRVKDPGNPAGTEIYVLEVPPETPPGTILRVARTGPFLGEFVKVRLRPLPGFRFKVRGSDLHCELKINHQRAMKGGLEFIQGPSGGRVSLKIPTGVASGTKIHLPGEGLPKARGGRGDLIVKIKYRPEVSVRRNPGR